MADITIRANEACAPDFHALWDSVWDAERGLADWQLTDGSEPHNHGGLLSRNGIATAVALALFTDRRIDPSHPLFELCDGDPRGWWGDAIDVRDDLGETVLGSYLWLLERAPMTIRGVPVEVWARQIALDALKPLLDQGVAVRIEVDAKADPLRGRLEMIIRIYGRDGDVLFDQTYQLLWDQVAGR